MIRRIVVYVFMMIREGEMNNIWHRLLSDYLINFSYYGRGFRLILICAFKNECEK